MKKAFIVVSILLLLCGCAKNTVDLTDRIVFLDDNTLSEENVNIEKIEYEVLESGDFRFYVSLKGPEGYSFLMFNSGSDTFYRSEFFKLTGKTQKFTVDVSVDDLKKMDELMGTVFKEEEGCFFQILKTKDLFE